MDVTVTLQVHGDPVEVGNLLSQIAGLLTNELDGSPSQDESRDDHDAGWWTPERADEFTRGLTLPALKALGIIAQRAPRVEFRELQQHMGASGMQLAGRLSSIGFAVSRQGAPFPFMRNYHQRAYFMQESVAALLGPAVEKELARRSRLRPRGRPQAARRPPRSARM